MTAWRDFAGCPKRSRWNDVVRRCAVWIFLGCYVLVATGLPIPVRGLTPQGTERFPCMHGACGCRTAEQCWRSCCCKTPAERLAWAKANNVTPPDYVLAMAKPREASRSKCESTRESSAGCCHREKTSARTACCRGESLRHPKQATCATLPVAASKGEQTQHVVLIDALKCRGLAISWSGGLIAVPFAPVAYEVSSEMTSWLGPIQAISGPESVHSPTTPPPEASVSV